MVCLCTSLNISANSLHNNLAFLPDITATSSKPNWICTLLKLPVLSNDIPDTQIAPVQQELYFHALTGLQEANALEASQLLLGRVGNTEVQLGYLVSSHFASVGDVDSCTVHSLPQLGMASLDNRHRGRWVGRETGVRGRFNRQVGIAECRVRKPVSELVLRRNVLRVKMAVIDVQPFSEVGLQESRNLWLEG